MHALPPRVQAYLEAIVRAGTQAGRQLVSVILFGSAATGGLSAASDVDVIIVLRDDASRQDRERLREDVARLEARHGFREDPRRPRGALEDIVARDKADGLSCF